MTTDEGATSGHSGDDERRTRHKATRTSQQAMAPLMTDERVSGDRRKGINDTTDVHRPARGNMQLQSREGTNLRRL
jgi:hypothetical protein